MLNAPLAWLTGILRLQSRSVSRKTVATGLALLAAALFGDTLLLLLKKTLHLLVEIFESIAEHFLQAAFHVTPRQAEMIVFWIDLLLAGVLLWILFNKAYAWTCRVLNEAIERWRLKTAREKRLALFWSAVILGSLFKISLLLFS